MPCPATQHQNNVPILRGEKHEISPKILHQTGFETARQAVTLAEINNIHSNKLTPYLKLRDVVENLFRVLLYESSK